jgi:hypothetical protein
VFAGRAIDTTQFQVAFAVRKAWKGTSAPTVVLGTGQIDKGNGAVAHIMEIFQFSAGQDYLVFAYPDWFGNPLPLASICGQTSSLGRDDVAKMDTMANAVSALAGKWRLDKPMSNLSGGLRENQAVLEQTLELTVAGSTLKALTTTSGGPLVHRETTDFIAVDGKSHEFVPIERIDSGPASGDRTATWLEHQRGFDVLEHVTRQIPTGPVTVKNTHKWSLSEDGRTLTIESVTSGPVGQIPTRRVFHR